ncbi:GAF domain-containing protein [Streptomyces sp. NPDC048720]|uniref:GAF domain-containing protein n=1 Tax=Streptomyces sp. NPDC048720 TaxID=3365588 RepID=UPI00371E5E3A
MCARSRSPTTRPASWSCSNCKRTRGPVRTASARVTASTPGTRRRTDRWPLVVPFALNSGFRAAHAQPLRVHGQTVGAVNLLLRRPGGLAPLELDLAQSLADVSAVALVTGPRTRCGPRTSPAAFRPRWPAARRSE